EEVIDLSDSLPRDALEDEAAIPDSQELMRRPEMLANWYARWHMSKFSTMLGTEELYDEILDRLRNIPDAELRVAKGLARAHEEELSMCQAAHEELAHDLQGDLENGWGKIHGSTLQLTKNLQTVEHQDQNNGGKSYGTTFGEHTGGGLWVEDANGEEQAHLKKEGSPEVLRGNRHQPRRALVQFDGNRIRGIIMTAQLR
ncbi:unnamed protein product, partial [Durusdinium trenchii]